MSPLRSQPAVVVVKPSDHGANIEGPINWVEDVGCAGYSGTVGDDSAFDNGPEEFRAFFKAEGFEATADSVEKDVSSSLKLQTHEVNGAYFGSCHGHNEQRGLSRLRSCECSWPCP